MSQDTYEISGPYHYAGDVHPSLRIETKERIVASIYIVDGDEERAYREAQRLVADIGDFGSGAEAELATLRATTASLIAAVLAYLPARDDTMEQMLWGDLPDDAIGNSTFRLGALRAVRAALKEAGRG